MFGQALNTPGSDAAEDFWNHWTLFTSAIGTRSLSVQVDPLFLGHNSPQYRRYHAWKGGGAVMAFLGMIVVWFSWQAGVALLATGVALHLWGSRIKVNDAKRFADNLLTKAAASPTQGGWLSYYYLQLYGAALITLLLSAQMITNLRPSNWDDPALHTLFVLSVVPPTLVQVVEIILATRLLIKSQRNEKNVTIFRYVLVASVIACAGSVAIDSVHFMEDVPLSIFSLALASIWCLYFYVSRRVRVVFARWSGTWNYESFKANTGAT